MSGCCDSGSSQIVTERDPVCGRSVNRVTAWRHEYADRDFFFCSARCQARFIAAPTAHLAAQQLAKPVGALTCSAHARKAWARVASALGQFRSSLAAKE